MGLCLRELFRTFDDTDGMILDDVDDKSPVVDATTKELDAPVQEMMRLISHLDLSTNFSRHHVVRRQQLLPT